MNEYILRSIDRSIARSLARSLARPAGLFVDFDLSRPQHTFNGITGNLTFSTHDSNGAFYYGADISVHPDFRRRGIGTRLYNCRKMVVRKFGKRCTQTRMDR